jgi:RNA-binding protein
MTDTPDLSSRQKKQLRQVAHHLASVVTIGDQGMSEGVLQETNRALTDHELIKVRLAGADRAERAALAESLATSTDAQIVHRIGKVIVLYRYNKKANPQLSNVLRYLESGAV